MAKRFEDYVELGQVSAREHKIGAMLRETLSPVFKTTGEKDWAIIEHKGREYKVQVYELGD